MGSYVLSFRGQKDRAPSAGDEAAWAVVRRAFAEKPERWRSLGDMASLARMSLARISSRKDGFPRIKARLNMMDAMEREITPPDASPLEKLLAARLALTWFEVHFLDCLVAESARSGVSFSTLERIDERRDRADRRFRHAIKDLATVRRLLRSGPVVQVNASMAQVNVGGGAPK